MKARTAIRAWACLLAPLLCQLATAADVPYRPHTVAKSNPSATGHARPSSFAPQHSSSHVYGAPIQPPILKMRKPSKPTPKAPIAATPSAATPVPKASD
jgi:hypothetical protein